MERLPYIAVMIAYAYLAVAHLLPAVVGEKGLERTRAVGIAGVTVHAITLIVGAVFATHPPGLAEALSATSLGIGIAYAWVVRGERLRSLGMFLAPLSLVLVGTAMVVPTHRVAALSQTGFSPWLPVHLTLIFTGVAGFALAGVVGATYLWARNRLKAKRFDGLKRLPPLEVLDRIQFRAMLFGFVFLTLGIGAGGMWAAASPLEGWFVDPKVVSSLLIWLWYGVALQLRLVAGHRGRWTALFSIFGFAGLVFSLFGVNFLLSGFHSYGG